MNSDRWRSVLGVLLGLLAPGLCMAQQSSVPTAESVSAVAASIDRHIGRRWVAESVVPAPLAADAEFCRRAYLALAGRIPHLSEISDFLEDERDDKRLRLVDALLESNGYVNHFTTVWRKVMLPEATQDFQSRFLIPGFEEWLRVKLVQRETHFDEIVREILTTDLGDGARGFAPRIQGASPIAYFQAKQDKPENLAAASSRMFLGVRIGCAQCHPHPFDRWTQEEFWSYAAFFSRIERPRQANLFSRISRAFDDHQIMIPGTDSVVEATFLDGSSPNWESGAGARAVLAEWLTSPENPYFAQATVNRIWGYLFGTGLVDPVDDFNDDHPASHPELLAELSQQLVAHNYDLKFLFRAIMASRTYQLSSRLSHGSQERLYLFAKFAPQPLTPEQLVNSLTIAVGRGPTTRPPRVLEDGTPRAELLNLFADDSESSADRAATILQALAMMNGRFVSDGTDENTGNTLAAILAAPWMDAEQQVQTLYLVTLARNPRPEELERLGEYVNSGGPRKDRARALGDVFWALLNSSEFLMNN